MVDYSIEKMFSENSLLSVFYLEEKKFVDEHIAAIVECAF